MFDKGCSETGRNEKERPSVFDKQSRGGKERKNGFFRV